MYSQFWVFVCSLGYPACNAHAPYCYLWPVRLYHIFPLYFTNGTIFEKKKQLLNIKRVFWFSLQLWSETILILGKNERDMIINVRRSSCQVPVILDRISRNNKTSNLVKIRLVGAELYHADGRRDRHTNSV